MTDEKKRPKCAGPAGPYCTLLDERIAPGVNHHGKGLTCIQFGNARTGDTWIAGVAYKKSARDKGLFLNVCPFCSEDIEPQKRKKAGS